MIRAGIFEALEARPVIVECPCCHRQWDAARQEQCEVCGFRMIDTEQEAAERLAEISRQIDQDAECGLAGQL